MSVGVLSVILALLITEINWTNKSIAAPALWPVGIADFAAICGSLKLIEKVMSRSEEASSRT